MQETLVDLIRHGEPVGGRRYRGNGADDPLSARGWEQMRASLAEHAPWHQVISSPMARCREFAVEIAGRHGLPLALEPGLIEIGMGAWEGRTHEAVAAEDPAYFEAFYRDPLGIRPPGGEPLLAFQARIAAAYARQVAVHPGRHLLICAHAGVMRALVGHLLGAEPRHWYRLRIDYAGIVRVRHGRFGQVIECVNAPMLPG